MKIGSDGHIFPSDTPTIELAALNRPLGQLRPPEVARHPTLGSISTPPPPPSTNNKGAAKQDDRRQLRRIPSHTTTKSPGRRRGRGPKRGASHTTGRRGGTRRPRGARRRLRRAARGAAAALRRDPRGRRGRGVDGGARRRRAGVFGQGGGGLPGLREFSVRLRAAGAGDGLQAAHADAPGAAARRGHRFRSSGVLGFFGASMAL